MRVNRLLHRQRVPRGVEWVFIDLLLSVFHLESVDVYLSLHRLKGCLFEAPPSDPGSPSIESGSFVIKGDGLGM